MARLHPALLVVVGVLLALGLAAFVALAPDPAPRLRSVDAGRHGDHVTYHPPSFAPYTVPVRLCLDGEGTAQVTDARTTGSSPTVRHLGHQTGTGMHPVVVSVTCDGDHGGQTVRLLLEGYTASGAPRTSVVFTYTVEGYEGEQEASVQLPPLTQLPA